MEEKAKKDRQKGIIILVCIVLVIIVATVISRFKISESKVLTDVFGAVGGGKENLLADKEIITIMNDEYKINFVKENIKEI